MKGAPEIVLGKCKDVMLDGKRVDAVEYRSTVEAQLLNYQNMAMRTLGFAFKIVDDAEASDCVSLVAEMTCRSWVWLPSVILSVRMCLRPLPNASRQVSE